MIAPVPWFPFNSSQFGEYARYARTPSREVRHGVEVVYPRYLMVPKIGMTIQPYTFALTAVKAAKRLLADGFDFDIIDAHYFYPDGVAAALAARWLQKPFVVTARGSDVNLLARQFPYCRSRILATARQAARIITVSAALKKVLVEIGVPDHRIVVLRNGVDTQVFQPKPRSIARTKLGIAAEPLLLAVGNLVPEKGHDLIIQALALIPDAHLVLVGNGSERKRLLHLTQQLNLTQRVTFHDAMPQATLTEFYNAADILVLASSREGWPNVLLEAMACGTPVVATDVGGVREILTDPTVGRIVTEPNPYCLATEINQILKSPPDRQTVRYYAEKFDWEAVSDGQLGIFHAALTATNPSVLK